MKAFDHKQCNCIYSVDAGLEHLSISLTYRYPTWDEIKEIRNEYLPKDKFFAIVLPPKEFYVNVHKYCFHLWEVKSELEINIWRGM